MHLPDEEIEKKYVVYACIGCLGYKEVLQASCHTIKYYNLLKVLLSTKLLPFYYNMFRTTRKQRISTQPTRQDNLLKDSLLECPPQNRYSKLSNALASANKNQFEQQELQKQAQLQANQYYKDDSFEDYSDYGEQAVQEEIDCTVDESYLKQEIETESIKPQSTQDDYQFYSMSYLNRVNQRLVQQIQTTRTAILRFKANKIVIRQQEKDLKELRSNKKKALNIQYQIALDHLCESKVSDSNATARNIQKTRANISKHSYQSVKQANQLSDPFCLNALVNDLAQSRIISQEAIHLQKLREQLLNKRRLQNRHSKRIGELNTKARHYQQLLDFYEGTICKGNFDSMTRRRQFLAAQLSLKRTLLEQSVITASLDNNALINEISQIEIQTIHINSALTSIQSYIKQFNEKLESSRGKIKVKEAYFKRRKLFSHPDLKVSNTKSNSKLSKHTPLEGKLNYSLQQSQQQRKEIIRFEYNHKLGRNYRPLRQKTTCL